jgi:hypothetical protein
VLVCGGALWKGDWEERLTATVLLANFAISLFMRDNSWPRFQATAFVADLATLGFFLGVALRSTKFWPMGAAAFQLLATLTHVAKMMDPLLHQWAYFTAIIIWTWLILVSLGVGTWNAWRRRGRERLAASRAEP